jgi:probable blue pigment (indigoidine) exporter
MKHLPPQMGLPAVTALAPLSWGTTYLVTTEWLPPDRPLFSGAVRALPAGLIAAAFGRAVPRGRWWWRAALLGVLNIGAFFPLLFVAAYRLPGGVAATLGATSPLVVAALALPLLGERPTRWRLAWAVAGVIGVALMVLRPGAHLDALGVLAGLGGTATMSSGVVLTRRWGNPVGAVPFAGWQLTAGGALLLPLALLVEGPPPPLSPAAVGGYAWLGLVGTLLAYTLWFRGIGRIPVAAVSLLLLLSPAVATLLGWAVLGQDLTVAQLAGLLLALAAVVAGQAIPPPRRPNTTSADRTPRTGATEKTPA